MPAQPVWYHRLQEIRTELEELGIEYLDRLTVEKLFGVRERRARQIMRGLPCVRVGNAIAVGRSALMQFLEGIGAGERFQREMGRRVRVVEELERTRRQLSARGVSIPASAELRNTTTLQLAEGTQLRQGELRITFHSAEDLATQLFVLSQAMANDWTTFRRAVESQPEGVRL